MQSQPTSKRRREIVSTDLFNVKKDVYLVVVDNLTKYWDLEQMNDTDAESTILQMTVLPVNDSSLVEEATEQGVP